MTAVDVFKDGYDWFAWCDHHCTRPLALTTGNWPDAYEIAVGHAHIYHPRKAT